MYIFKINKDKKAALPTLCPTHLQDVNQRFKNKNV